MINWTESSSVLNTTLYFRVTQGFQWDPNFNTLLQKQYSRENFLNSIYLITMKTIFRRKITRGFFTLSDISTMAQNEEPMVSKMSYEKTDFPIQKEEWRASIVPSI